MHSSHYKHTHTHTFTIHQNNRTNLPALASCSIARPQPLTSEKVRMQWIQTLKLAAVTWTSLRTKSLRVLQHLKKISGSCGLILSSTRTSNLHRDSRSRALEVFIVAASGVGSSLWELDSIELVVVDWGGQIAGIGNEDEDWFEPIPTHSKTKSSIIHSLCVFTEPAWVWMSSATALAICLCVASR